MKKLYAIIFTVLFNGLTENFLIGMEQSNNFTEIPITTAVIAYPVANNSLQNIISYDQNISFETKYCSNIYVGYPKNLTTAREQAFMAQSTIAAIKAYDENLPKAMNDYARNGIIGGVIIGTTLGAAITYAYMKNKK